MIELQARELSKKYSQLDVFTALSFQYESGVIGIAGSNGAGKSTLLQCLAGILKLTNGTIEWQYDGDIIKLSEIKKHLGFVAPYVQLYEELTAIENLTFLKDLHPTGSTSDPHKLIERFQAGEFKNSLYGELSTGQQQRIKFAAACIHQPKIICLDEPGSNLDPSGIQLIRNWIDKVKENDGMVILASNQSNELDLCDNIIQL